MSFKRLVDEMQKKKNNLTKEQKKRLDTMRNMTPEQFFKELEAKK